MWRLGVLLVVTVLLDSAAADVKPTENLIIQRLKRSPHHPPPYCNDYGYSYYRPGPPPPPPPPPFYWRPPPPPPPPPPPSPSFYQQYQTYPEANQDEPCSTCGGRNGASLSISKAETETGDAIAVAVAKAKTN